MKRTGDKSPILAFPTPSVGKPKAVRDAEETFDEVATRCARTMGEVRESAGSIKAAIARDQDEYLEALREDDGAVPGRQHESDARLAQAQAERKLAALQTLADEAGDEYARTIGEHRDAWLAAVRKAEAELAEGYKALVAEVERTLTQLVELRAGASWLENYTTAKATLQDPNLTGGDVRFRTGWTPPLPVKINPNADRVRDRYLVPVPVLIDALESVTAEPEPTQTTPPDKAVIV